MTTETPSLALWSTIFCSIFLVRGFQPFLNALRAKYIVTFDMEATVYIGIKLDWEYVHRTVTLSMPNYVRKDFHIFQHILMGDKE